MPAMMAKIRETVHSRLFYPTFLALAIVWLLLMIGAYTTLRTYPVSTAQQTLDATEHSLILLRSEGLLEGIMLK